MSGAITTSVSGLDSVQDWLANLPDGLEASAVVAINRVLRHYRPELAKQLAARTGVPQSVLQRRKRAQSKAAKRGAPGVLWAGLNPVPALDAGRVPQDYPGAFWAFTKTRTQSLGIFRRVGPSRLPIEKEYAPLDEGEAVLFELKDTIAQALLEEFEQELRDGR